MTHAFAPCRSCAMEGTEVEVDENCGGLDGRCGRRARVPRTNNQPPRTPSAAPTTRRPTATHGRIGNSALASPCTATPELASAFMSTTLQSPARESHRSVWRPVPCVDFSQIDSLEGGADGGPPACVVSAVTWKLSIVAYPAPRR